MNNEPLAWMAVNELNGSYSTFTNDQKQKLLPHVSQCYGKWIPLYTHPHPDNLGLALSIIDQQKIEIEALKASHIELERGIVKDLNQRQSAEPVAWMMVNRENTSAYLTFDKPTRDMKISHEPHPLYTHPVKELTDEEIAEIAMQCSDMDEYGNSQLKEYEFARAILRKAQEK